MSTPEPTPVTRPRGAPPSVWTASTYFAEGFPYAVVNNVAEVYFAEMGASLKTIGLTSLLHLPWNLKFLWSPFLDEYRTKRFWLLLVEVLLVFALAGLTVGIAASLSLFAIGLLYLAVAVLSATHDIAVDGYYLEALDDRERAKFVGLRAPAYRAAILLTAGPMLVLCQYAGFTLGYAAKTLVMLLLAALHFAALPRAEAERAPLRELSHRALRPAPLAIVLALAGLGTGLHALLGSEAFRSAWTSVMSGAPRAKEALEKIDAAGWAGLLLLLALAGALAAFPWVSGRLRRSDTFYARAFVDFLDQPKVGLILAFVLLFRLGESFLMKMKYPFLKSIGMSMDEYGIANGTIGLLMSLVAPAVGGVLLARHGVRRWVWPFVLAQNLLNLTYVALAAAADDIAGPAAFYVYTVVIAVESFGAGLGTAFFMVFIMRCCRPDFRAAHMAILTALMSVGFTAAGVFSGFLAEWMGFGPYFFFTFLATFPAMLLLPRLPHLDGEAKA